MIYNAGVRPASSTVRIPWNTGGANGASITRATNGTLTIYKDGGTTERASAAGVTDTEDFDAKTGLHVAVIDLSDNTDAGFYAAGSMYMVAIVGAVIDGQTVNAWIGTFEIGVPVANVTQLAGVAQSLTDLKHFADSGYDPDTTKVNGVKLVDTTTTKTDMRGTDSAMLAASAPANFGDLAITATTGRVTAGTVSDKTGYALSATQTFNMTGDITGNLSGSVGSVTGNVTGFVGSLATQAKADVNAEVDTALADVNLDHLVKSAVDTNFANTVHLDSVLGQMADNGTSASFDRTTDSLEAVGTELAKVLRVGLSHTYTNDSTAATAAVTIAAT